MALNLLTDENISPVVAERITALRPDIPIISIQAWHNGKLLHASDREVLHAAALESKTVVTYDTRILTEIADWFEEEISFSGVIFVDDRTIASHDFGTLIRSLIALWDRESNVEWWNRVVYLTAA